MKQVGVVQNRPSFIAPHCTILCHGDGYVVTAVVELANRGGQNTKINWKDEPPAFHVKFDADGKPKYDPPTRFRVPLTLHPKSSAVSHVIPAARIQA